MTTKVSEVKGESPNPTEIGPPIDLEIEVCCKVPAGNDLILYLNLPKDLDLPSLSVAVKVMKAKLSEIQMQIRIELLKDYRMIQNYAESILGEVGSIDIS